MEIERADFLTQAFVLEPDNLKALYEKLGKLVDIVRLQINCKDNFTRKFQNFSELLEYENMPKNEIESLTLIGITTTTSPKFTVAVSFEQKQTRNVYLSVKGDEIRTLEANRAVESSLEGMKPWYDFVARRDLPTILFGLIFIVSVSNTIRSAFGGEPLSLTPSSLTFSQIILVVLICAAVMLVIYALVEILNRVKKKAFPMAVFAIGNGERRHKNNEIYRVVFIAGFFVSVAASLVMALLALPML